MAMVLLATNRVRIDVIGLMVLAVLGLSGEVRTAVLFRGYSSEAVVLIATMLAFGEALAFSGAAGWLAGILQRHASKHSGRLTVVTMIAAALPSMLISDVGLVGMFIPVVKNLYRSTQIPVRRLLLPLAIAATLGGNLTMVSSTSNIVGNTALKTAGVKPFPLFGLAPYGLVLLAAGMAFVVLLGKRLIPVGVAGTAPLESEERDLREYVVELTLDETSPLVGRTLEECSLFSEHGITVIRIHRGDQTIEPRGDTELHAQDLLVVLGDVDSVLSPRRGTGGIHLAGRHAGGADPNEEGDILELLLSHRSPWARQTVQQLDIRRRYGASVLGLYRKGHLLYGRLNQTALRVGDVLLMQATPAVVELVKQQGLLVSLDQAGTGDAVPSRALWITPSIMVAALVAAALHLASVEVAIVAALVLIILLGLTDIGRAYRAIEWRIIVFVGGMTPLSTAMVQSGITGRMAHALDSLGGLGHEHWLLLAVLFGGAAVLTQIISNIATVMVLTPIAIHVGHMLSVQPYPLVLAILSAAAASPLTPLSNKQTLLIMGPGGYSYGDFFRFGLPFTLALGAIAVLLIPVFFPF